MSQYRDSFTGRGGGGGGGGGRNRNEGEEYVYRGREAEEDDGSQYSPETRYGFGAVPVPEVDSRPSNRPNQQPRRPLQPMSSRQDGSGGQSFPIPPVPRAPSNSSRGSGPPPPRPPRPSYIPSNLDSSEVQEVQQNPNFSYRLNQQPVRSQPRYSQQSEDEEDFLSPMGHPSISSSRSIFIGFDPSNPSGPSNPPGPSAASLGVIPNFPPVPPPAPSAPSRKSLGVGPPPSARRGTSSYYSQQTLMVSPIPEEPIDRHGSYASSAAIPTSWSSGPVEYYNGDNFIGDSDSDSEIYIDNYTEIESGLVRHASLGQKSRPVITEIKSPSGLRGGSKSSSNESFKAILAIDNSVGVALTASRPPAAKSPPTVGGSAFSLPNIHPRSQARSPASSTPSPNPSVIRQPILYTADNYMDERFSFPRGASQSSSPSLEKELGYLTPTSPWATTPTSMKFPAPVGSHPGRKIPPRLNLDAVREAEARGSLTSLPDLIRRATKLAAVLETGRPDSRWGLRGSFMGNSSTSRSNRRDTDSISDILASFPPPALAQGKRPTSQWPLPGDYTRESESIRPARREGRRVCGLPAWGFVLIVILALVVITAAVVVPLQLVSLYKGKNNNGSASTLAACKQNIICMNGGETIAMKDFCGCVCTNGFTGSTCSQKADSSCTTVDLKDAQDGKSKGIQNVTMGNALPRLFEIAYPFYNIQLDMARVLAVFSNQSISCTAQNALVTFNGKAVPSTADDGGGLVSALPGVKRGESIVTDTPDSSSTAVQASSVADFSGNSRVPQLDPDAIDFARVVVMYLTTFGTLMVAGDAQGALQSGFSAGRDFGNLSIGNNNTVNFDNRSIRLSDGSMVGSVMAINSTMTSRRSVVVTYLRELLS